MTRIFLTSFFALAFLAKAVFADDHDDKNATQSDLRQLKADLQQLKDAAITPLRDRADGLQNDIRELRELYGVAVANLTARVDGLANSTAENSRLIKQLDNFSEDVKKLDKILVEIESVRADFETTKEVALEAKLSANSTWTIFSIVSVIVLISGWFYSRTIVKLERENAAAQAILERFDGKLVVKSEGEQSSAS